MSLEGKIINGYHLDEQLSHDKLADVYVAHKTDGSQRKVAIKLLHQSNQDEAVFLNRFMREMRILKELQHPNLIPVIEWGMTETGAPYLVSEFMGGLLTLRDVMSRQALTLEDSWLVMKPIAEVLNFIHSHKILHRDIKPSKIFVKDDANNFHIYLGNFGLSRQLDFDATVTGKGQIIGTVQYLAPEIVRDEDIDQRADLYSFGVVMYEITTGTVPFPKSRRTTDQVAVAHALENPPLPSQNHPDFPKALEGVIMRAMSKMPDDRYPDALSFAQAYAQVLDNLSDAERRRDYWR